MEEETKIETTAPEEVETVTEPVATPVEEVAPAEEAKVE